jgi:hypothetical protein
MGSHNNHESSPSTHNHESGAGRQTEDLLSRAYERLKLGQPYIVNHTGQGGGHDHGQLESLRKFEHKGHSVVIRTHYTVTVDGQPINAHMSVDNKGRLNTHALPNYSFNSAVDLIKALIDCLPSSFSNK